MNHNSIAPCGLLCDLCLGFQRSKNKCDGCNSNGNKPYHCSVCSIKNCVEKSGNDTLLCHECVKFPCRRLKDLDKRYRLKYGESPIANFNQIKMTGVLDFIEKAEEKWTCGNCGQLVCMHRSNCLNCGALNSSFPQK